MKKSLTTGEVAKCCGVNHRTILRWIKAGMINAFQLPGRGDHRIPVAECVRFLKAHDIPVPEELRDATPSNRVLIVDDEPEMQSMMRLLLAPRGYEVQVASDGFEAGTLLGTFEPGLLILDLRMPRLDGYGVLRFIKKGSDSSRLKILVVSGLAPDKLQEAIETGADDVLAKPFMPEDFLAKVAELLPPPAAEAAAIQ